MNDFHTTYDLVYGRMIDSIKDLSDEQLRWRIQPGAPSIYEMVLHCAGVEVMFAAQLATFDLDEFDERIKKCARDGIVNDDPYPFEGDDLSIDLMNRALSRSHELITPLITDATDEVRNTQIESALGPIIDGNGAFARIAYHPGYHTGQIWTYRYHPDFPS